MPPFNNQFTHLYYSENNALSMENFGRVLSFLEGATTMLMMLLVSISVGSDILIHFFCYLLIQPQAKPRSKRDFD